MKRNEIGFGKQALERDIDGAELLLLGLLHRTRSVIENAHGKALGARRHSTADATAPADKTNGLAMNARAEQVIRLRARKNSGTHQLIAFHYAPGDRQQQREMRVGG